MIKLEGRIMKKTILTLVAGLCLSVAAPAALATNQTKTETKTETLRGGCCTPQGCGICIPVQS